CALPISEVRPQQIIITAPYPGAAPQEIEETLARKIEDRVFNLPEVEEISSVVTEGMASVRLEYPEGVDIDAALNEVKREVDALEDLPEDADRILVSELEPRLPAISLSLITDADEGTLKRMIRQMRDDLELLPGMGDVEVTGTRTREISIEIKPEALLEHRLSLPMISQRVGDAMAEIPAGPVRGTTSHISVRTIGAEERAEEVRDIIVKADASGQILRLGDIALVREGFVDVDYATRLNGKPCVSLTAYTEREEDAIEISDMIRAYADGRMRQAPPFRGFDAEAPPGKNESGLVQAYRAGLARTAVGEGDIILHTDLARFIRQRLNLLLRNAMWGGALVFLTLFVMLNWRVAFWVGVGLSVSLLGTLAAMHFLGITLNLLTMFGLIVVLGLLVDDAIVVAENIVSKHEEGEPALNAAIEGTRQVSWPVVTTVLTTICAFMPLTLIQGRIGDLLSALPVVVSIALLVSLVESLFILPSHMGHSLATVDRRRGRGRQSRFSRFVQNLQERYLRRFIELVYRRLLGLTLRYRYFAVVIALTTLIASLSLPAGGRLGFSFSPSADSETVVVDVTLPVGSPKHVTDAIVKRVEDACLKQPEVVTAFGLVGINADPNGDSFTSQAHLGQLYLELKPAEKRERNSDQVISAIRQELGVIPGIKSLRMSGIHGGPGGMPITFTVASTDPGQIQPVIEGIRELLQQYEGIFAIADDSDRGQRERRIKLRDGARELGLTTSNVAMQIRAAVFGLEAHTFAADQEDADVRVMADEHTRRSLASLESMHIFTPSGKPVPLSEVATLEDTMTYATVRRLDRRRAVSISADVDTVLTNAETVLTDLAPHINELRRQSPGVRIIPRGRQEEIMDSLSTLPIGMLTAAGLIYVILAWLFSSYTQPLIVMLAIPFATIGMVWGHLLMGYDLTILSLIGFVALAGIVVNDSLIFMEFYNMKRRAGLDASAAAYATGQARLRPILLTTITTVLGLSPLMLEQSFQARFLIPMAITISFGLLAATALTLLLLPALLVIAHDLRRLLRIAWTGRLDTRGEPRLGPAAPAPPTTHRAPEE
ncbi:MAG: efflux RND transporter permease subunit, partial [Phycisphaerales bacterium JB038]